jgi:hypothetical protein
LAPKQFTPVLNKPNEILPSVLCAVLSPNLVL